MLAAVYHGPEDLHVEEHPTPTVGENITTRPVRAASHSHNSF